MPDVTVEIRIPSGQAFSSIFKRSLPMYLCQRIAKVYIRVFLFYLSLVGHSGVPICKMLHEKLKKRQGKGENTDYIECHRTYRVIDS